MIGINKELDAKIKREVKEKELKDAAKDLVERRRPTTRAKIAELEDEKRLRQMLEY